MLGRQAGRAWLACLAVWAVYALWPSSVIRAYFDNGISQKLVTATGWLSDNAVQRLICTANLFGRGDNQCDLVVRCQKSVGTNRQYFWQSFPFLSLSRVLFLSEIVIRSSVFFFFYPALLLMSRVLVEIVCGLITFVFEFNFFISFAFALGI